MNDEPVWPGVWSGGQVIACSDLDAPTHWATARAATLLPDRLGVLLDTATPLEVVLRVAVGDFVLDAWPPGAANPEVTIDSAGVRVGLTVEPAGHRLEVLLGWRAENTLHGRITITAGAEGPVTIALALSSPEPLGVANRRLQLGDETLALSAQPEPVVGVAPALSVADLWRLPAATGALPSSTPEPVSGQACLAIWHWPSPNDCGPVEFHLAPADSEPAGGPALQRLDEAPRTRRAADWGEQTAAKARTILRAAVLGPDGNLPRRWLASHRTQQRYLNTFQAAVLADGVATFDADLAIDLARCALSQQQANGHLPELAWPDGRHAAGGPLLLCWTIWRLYRRTGDKVLLQEVVSRLKEYVKYPLAARLLERLGHARSGGARFLTWGLGDGSNMDNSPRFDLNEPFAAVDLTSYVTAEIRLVARMIDELSPDHREGVHLDWMGQELARETSDYFWHEPTGCFYDRYPDDDWVEVRTVAGLVPLFCRTATVDQAGTLVERHVRSPEGFWTPFPVPSLAADDSRYSQNMWRGAAWPAMNVLVHDGLRSYGYAELAAELAQRTIDQMTGWYRQTGSLWEYYDSSGERSPAELPRGRRVGALADYPWSAAAYLALLDRLGER